ncbi:MAG: glycosyltransferase family 39 protein [Candidatus Alcyoniella australis]|nr:glycosyltransferase family 39 protein [Candidatus Alcyoniella australis]
MVNSRQRVDWALALLIVLFLIWRAVLLLYSPYVYDEEEYKTGSIAHLVIVGPQLPLLELTPGDYEGGTLVAGLLTVIPFKLLGENHLALKTVAIAFSLLLLVSIYLLVKRLASRTAALIAGGMLILAPPYVSQVTLLPWGNYAEAAALSALTFLIAMPMFERGSRSPIRMFALGLLAGFGTYMHYGYLAAPLSVCLMWFARDRLRFFGPALLYFLLGALIGFAPWILYNATHDFWGLQRIRDAIGSPGSGAPVGVGERLQAMVVRFGALFIDDLPASFHFRDSLGLPRKLWAYVWYLPACVGLIIVALKSRGGPRAMLRGGAWPKGAFACVIWVYLLIYALIFSATDYGLFLSGWQSLDPESHAHIFVMLPWLAAAIGLSAHYLLNGSRPKIWLPLLLCGPLIAGTIGQSSLLQFDKPQVERLRSKAWDEGIIYVEIGSKWARDPDRLWEIGGQLGDLEASYFSFGVGIQFGLWNDGSARRALQACDRHFDRANAPYCALGVGVGLYTVPNLSPTARRAVIDAVESDYSDLVKAGAAIGEIWVDAAAGPYFERSWQRDFRELGATPEDADRLQRFIDLQLKMLEVQPPK